MPDPSVVAAAVLLLVLVELAHPVRVPAALLLAVIALASATPVGQVVALGTIGAVTGRLLLAYGARRPGSGARRAGTAEREHVRTRLAGSRHFPRLTFGMGLLPFVPPTLLFPLLGAMRAPVRYAAAGAAVGRLAWFSIATALWLLVARLLPGASTDDARSLGVFAAVLVVARTLAEVDWAHRRAEGGWRWRERRGALGRVAQFGAGPGRTAGWSGHAPSRDGGQAGSLEDGDVVEGELLGEDVEPS